MKPKLETYFEKFKGVGEMMKKYAMMNFIFFDMAIAGGMCGYMCHKYNVETGWGIFIGIILTMIAMFVGMMLAFMVTDDRERGKRIKIEQNYQMQLQNIVMNERLNGAKVAVNMSKAMADKIATTIVSKFVTGMSDETTRRQVSDGANNIVADEVESLQKALFDGLEEKQK